MISEEISQVDLESWCSLPEHIIVHIFSYLPLSSRYQASLACKFWQHCFKSQYLWRTFNFEFYVQSDARFLHCVKVFGHRLQHVSIDVDQSVQGNRENACAVIDQLALTDSRCLSSIKIRFTGQNPLFYTGLEFISSLQTLFGPPLENVHTQSQIKYVDLSGLIAAVNENVLDLLSENNPDLEKLNLQNKSLYKIIPECIGRVIQRCRNIVDLRLNYCSLSEEVLLAFIEDGRTPLRHLGITCRREEKFCKDLSSEMWKKLTDKLPNLRVTLGFDPTCPLHKVSAIMKPEIPVSVMLLKTYTRIYDEVNLVAAYYKKTLEKLVINTQTSSEFEHALLEVCTKCHKLDYLYVFNCVLGVDLVEQILKLHPSMRARASYLLRTVPFPESDLLAVCMEESN